MNDSVATPHQISFILDKQRYQQNFLIAPDDGRALYLRLSQEVDGLKTEGFALSLIMDMSDLQVYPLSPSSGEGAMAAQSLLENIASALDLDYDTDETLAPVIEKAKALDSITAALSEDETQGTLVEFTWNNGGGDDNAYADTFCSTKVVSGASGHFEDALENWMQDEGHAYDFSFMDADKEPPTMDASAALEDLSGTLLDNSSDHNDSLINAWGKVLARVATELKTAAATPPISRARKSRP